MVQIPEVPPLQVRHLPEPAHERVVREYMQVIGSSNPAEYELAQVVLDPVLFPGIETTPTAIILDQMNKPAHQDALFALREEKFVTVLRLLRSVVLGNAVAVDEIGHVTDKAAEAIARSDMTPRLAGWRRRELRGALNGLHSPYDAAPLERSTQAAARLRSNPHKAASFLVNGLASVGHPYVPVR